MPLQQQCTAPLSAPLQLLPLALLDYKPPDETARGLSLDAAPSRLQGAAFGAKSASFRKAFSEPVGDYRGGDPGDDPIALLNKASSGLWRAACWEVAGSGLPQAMTAGHA